MGPQVQRGRPGRADVRADRWTAPFFASILEFLKETVDTAIAVAARAVDPSPEAEPPADAAIAVAARAVDPSPKAEPPADAAIAVAARAVDRSPEAQQPAARSDVVEPAPVPAVESEDCLPLSPLPAPGAEPRVKFVPPVHRSRGPRLTVKRLVALVEENFGKHFSRETIRRALHSLKLSWKKAKKLLARADPAKREAFLQRIEPLLERAMHDDKQLLVYIDEAHVHLDADLGYGWAPVGSRLWVASSSPGLAKVSFYGIYLYNEGQVRIWPYERANGEHTIDVLNRLRKEFSDRDIKMIWDGASYHRSAIVRDTAASLNIECLPLPAYSPDFMPVESLWHWLREDVTYNYCHDTHAELIENVAKFQNQINQDPCAIADRLWVRTDLKQDEENIRFSK